MKKLNRFFIKFFAVVAICAALAVISGAYHQIATMVVCLIMIAGLTIDNSPTTIKK